MHPYYLLDFISKFKASILNDVGFLSEGLTTTYKLASPKDATNVQWDMAAISRTAEELLAALNALEKELDTLNKKNGI